MYEVFSPVEPVLEVTGFDCSTGVPVFDFGTSETYAGGDFNWDFGNLASSGASNLAAPDGIGFPEIEDVEAELTVVLNGCIRAVASWIGRLHPRRRPPSARRRTSVRVSP